MTLKVTLLVYHVRRILQRGKSGINVKVTLPSLERHADQMARNWQIPHSGDMATYWAKNIDFSPRRQSQFIASRPYTVLQSQIQINAVADGYDPTIGIMHEGSGGSPAFIFDMMEPGKACD